MPTLVVANSSYIGFGFQFSSSLLVSSIVLIMPNRYQEQFLGVARCCTILRTLDVTEQSMTGKSRKFFQGKKSP